MSQDLINTIVRLEVVYAAIPGLIFCLVYQLRWKWWKTAFGRHMMIFMCGLELILLLTVLAMFWPDMPHKGYIRMSAWALISFLFTWRTWVLVFIDSYEPELSGDHKKK